MLSNKGGSSLQTAEYQRARDKREQEAELEREVAVGTAPAGRTSVGLRNALFDEIDALRRGDGKPERAIALSKLAATILDTVRVEIQFKKSGLDQDPTSTGIMLGGPAEKK